MKSYDCIVLFAAFLSPLTGCNTTQNELVLNMRERKTSSKEVYNEYYKKARPFAVLYGNVKGRWIDHHEYLSLNDSNPKSYPPWIIERAGFIQLDENNKRRYLILMFATCQPQDAEKSAQLTELVRIYSEEFGIDSLQDHISALDRDGVQSLVHYLGGSVEQFYSVAKAYCSM